MANGIDRYNRGALGRPLVIDDETIIIAEFIEVQEDTIFPTLWSIFKRLWNTGNRLARYSLFIIAVWPVLLGITAALPIGMTWKAAIAMVPALAFVLLLLTKVDPLILPILDSVVKLHKKEWSIIRWILTVVGAELLAGLYFAIIPADKDPGLILLFMLVATTLFFLSFSAEGIWMKRARTALILGLFAITGIFLYGGRAKVESDFQKKPSPQPITQSRGPVVENGLLIPEPNTYDVPRVSLKKETKVEQHGPGILFTTNCTEEREMKELGLIPPGKTLVIRHVTLLKPEDNRCSIVDWEKHGIYWYGPGGREKEQFRRQYKNDVPLPFADVPPQAVAFLMVEASTGKEITHGFAKYSGDMFRLENASNEPAIVYGGIFNYPQLLKKGYEGDIGYDGSTQQYAMSIE